MVNAPAKIHTAIDLIYSLLNINQTFSIMSYESCPAVWEIYAYLSFTYAVHSSKQQAASTNTPVISHAEDLNKSKLEIL